MSLSQGVTVLPFSFRREWFCFGVVPVHFFLASSISLFLILFYFQGRMRTVGPIIFLPRPRRPRRTLPALLPFSWHNGTGRPFSSFFSPPFFSVDRARAAPFLFHASPRPFFARTSSAFVGCISCSSFFHSANASLLGGGPPLFLPVRYATLPQAISRDAAFSFMVGLAVPSFLLAERYHRLSLSFSLRGT